MKINGLIWNIVKRFLGRGYEAEDLYQIACIGFIEAIKRFKFEFNVELSTYSVQYMIGEIKKFLRDDGTWAVPELDESVLAGYLPLTGGMTTGTTGLAGNFRVYVGEFTRIQFLLNGQWVTVISGDNTNNGIIVGNLGLEKAAFNVDDPSHAYVNSYPIYSAGYKPYKTGSFGKASGAVTIDCGFKPSYVVIFCDTPSTYIYSTGVSVVFTLNTTGFVVSADIPSGKYSYIAFR